MVNGKLNLVADDRKKSLEYAFAGVDVQIKDKLESIGTIRWGGESSVTLEQQYATSKGTTKRGFPAEERRKAGDWLEKHLADGPKECLLAGENAGFNKWTLRDAKKERGIGQKRVSGHVVWCLPVDGDEV
jgi:hypothetical protein